jgi:hypothetical protein
MQDEIDDSAEVEIRATYKTKCGRRVWASSTATPELLATVGCQVVLAELRETAGSCINSISKEKTVYGS